jgi:hypothetical protein
MSAEYGLLRAALLARTACFAFYDGYQRHFCPHVIGWKGNEEQVLCWQYAGESSRPLPAEGQWKCFTVAKFSHLSTTAEAWRYGQPGRTGRPTSCVDIVDQEIVL